MSILKKIPFILIVLALVFGQAMVSAQPALAASSASRVYASSVEEDRYVSLAGSNLFANTRYSVYLSKFKTGAHSASILVGSVVTDSKGAFQKTYRIPGKLVDVSKIKITVTNGKGDTATNWFINASSDDYTGGEGSAKFSFTVVDVKKNAYAKIKTSNLPANVSFNVYMGKAGSQGLNGTKVGTLVDSKGGAVKATFEIPDKLEGKAQIDIRLENKALGIFYYITFDNKK